MVTEPEQDTDQGTIRFADEVLAAGFTQVPNHILDDATLSPGARLLWIQLARFAWREGQVFPGQQRLSEQMGMSDRTVRTLLAELRDCGLVEVKRRGLGLTNIYLMYVSRPEAGFRSGAEAGFRSDRKQASGLERKPASDKEDTVEEDTEKEEPSPDRLFDAGDAASELWDHYRKHVPNGQKQLTPERRRELKAALKARDLETCKLAVEWLGRSPWHNGASESGNTYLDLRYAIGKIKQSEAIGDRIETMAKHAQETAQRLQEPTVVEALIATLPSEVHAMVRDWVREVETMLRKPDSAALRMSGEGALRDLHAKARIQPVITDGRIETWQRVEQ